MNRVSRLAALAAATLVLAAPGVARGEPPAGNGAQAEGPSVEALDYAFRFASAISTDDKDRAKAQAAVVRDLTELGAFEEASSRASVIGGWRHAVALAELSEALARSGRAAEGRRYVEEAQRLRGEVTDWHGSRVDSQVAQALAALGQVDASQRLAQDLVVADRLQYLGQATLIRVKTHVSAGEFEAAMSLLREMELGEDFELPWWRFQGYLEIGGASGMTREQRLQALNAAREGLAAVPGGRMSQSLESLAEGYHAIGAQRQAEEALSEAAAIVDQVPDHYPEKSSELANLARVWARIGRRAEARDLLRAAEAVASHSQPVEQPTLYAWVASTYLAIDDTPDALRVLERALSVADTLVNPRPRALAYVAIARSMGQRGMPVPDSVRPRLDAALEGL
jgi:tetratricopeptide (TPR) repeat protein